MLNPISMSHSSNSFFLSILPSSSHPLSLTLRVKWLNPFFSLTLVVVLSLPSCTQNISYLKRHSWHLECSRLGYFASFRTWDLSTLDTRKYMVHTLILYARHCNKLFWNLCLSLHSHRPMGLLGLIRVQQQLQYGFMLKSELHYFQSLNVSWKGIWGIWVNALLTSPSGNSRGSNGWCGVKKLVLSMVCLPQKYFGVSFWHSR